MCLWPCQICSVLERVFTHLTWNCLVIDNWVEQNTETKSLHILLFTFLAVFCTISLNFRLDSQKNGTFEVKKIHIYVYMESTQSGKGRQDLKKLLLLGPPNSKNLGNFLQHMQKSKSFDYPFLRNLDLKFFPYKTSRDRKARITKWSVWRSSWSKKSH